MLYWPVLLIIVMLCMAVCVCKRWCYINMLGNMSPPTHKCTHLKHGHTCTHAHRVGYLLTLSHYIASNAQFHVKSITLYKVRMVSVSLSMLYYTMFAAHIYNINSITIMEGRLSTRRSICDP